MLSGFGVIRPLSCRGSLKTLSLHCHSVVAGEFAAAAISRDELCGHCRTPQHRGRWRHFTGTATTGRVCPQRFPLCPYAHSVRGLCGCSKRAGWKAQQLRGGFSTPAPRSVTALTRAASAGAEGVLAAHRPRSSCSSSTGSAWRIRTGLPAPGFPARASITLRPPLLSGGCARQRGRNCAAMHHQLTAHYYKTLPTGLKRLEEPRSGFSWSHAQKPVPLTLETKCFILKIINGKH